MEVGIGCCAGQLPSSRSGRASAVCWSSKRLARYPGGWSIVSAVIAGWYALFWLFFKTTFQGSANSSQIGLLVVSASIISSSVYFLWRITTFPEISNVDAILIGAAITCAIFLCSWGIGSGRGNPVESSLLVRPIRPSLLASIDMLFCSLPTSPSAFTRFSRTTSPPISYYKPTHLLSRRYLRFLRSSWHPTPR